MKNFPVIVADSNAARLQRARACLGAGHEVLTCGDGHEVVVQIESRRPAVLVIDSRLTGLAVAGLYRKLAKSDLSDEIYVILTTDNDRPEQTSHCLDGGVDDWLTHPVHNAVLLARIQAGQRTLHLRQQQRDHVRKLESEIAERKQAEQALRDERDRLRSIVEAIDGIDVMLTMQDRDYNIVYQNSLVVHTFGAGGGKCHSAYEGKEQVCDDCAVKKAFEDGMPHTAERVVTTDDGEAVYLENAAYPVRNANGEITSCVEIVRDVTERRSAERASRNNERFLTAIFEAMQDGVSVLDRDLNIVRVNSAAEARYADEMPLAGRKCYSVYHGRETPCPNCPSLRTLREGRTCTAVNPCEVRGEITGWLELTTYPVKDEDGEVTGVLEYVKDITERRSVEQSLRTGKRQLSNAMKIARLGYWEFDVKKGLFTFDDHFYALFRTTAEEVGGYTMSPMEYAQRFLLANDIPLVAEETRRAMETTDPYYSRQFEHRFRYADGEVGYMAIRFFIVKDEHGNTVRTYGANQDITERKRGEERLDALRHELQAASHRAGMAEVATGVLHNVGNVLNSVNVSASVITDKIRGSKAQELTRLVKMLDEHADDLGTFVTEHERGRHVPRFLAALADSLTSENTLILEELRSLSNNIDHIKSIVSTQQSYAGMAGLREPISLADLLEDSLKLHTASFERHSIKVERDYATLPPLETEKQKLLQILINLITNAQHALVEGENDDRRLTLRLVAEDDNRISIEIADNGVGIPAENLTRIFAHGFTSRKNRGGRGFGLHHSALAAKELGGSLTAHSDGPGTGATFRLELPLRSRTATPTSTADAGAS